MKNMVNELLKDWEKAEGKIDLKELSKVWDKYEQEKIYAIYESFDELFDWVPSKEDKKIIKDGLRSKLKEKIYVELSEELEGIEDLVKFKEFAKNNLQSQKKTILTEIWLEIIDNLILEIIDNLILEEKEFKENK